MDHFESYYWICYSIASILCFGFWPGGMWDFSCLTRDQTHTLALVGKVLSTGWPGKSVYLLLICWMSWKLDDFFWNRKQIIYFLAELEIEEEIEENNRMGKTRDHFKKIRDTKGTFHVKMGSIKDRNGMDLTEAEDIKKRCQEYRELYKIDLHDPDNHDAVITHLEPDILECEVKWALESITMNKTSGVDGIPVELFQILKDDAV